jgi:hypothetical protein
MHKVVWNVLKTNLVKNGYEKDMIRKNEWGTFWQFAFKKNLKIKKGSKGIKVKIKKLRFVFIKDDNIVYECNKDGFRKPKFRVINFNKSFFHISQTEPKNIN